MSEELIINNEPQYGIKSKITIMTNNQNSLFIRENNPDLDEVMAIWLSNESALKIATWILDNVEVKQ